MIGWYAENAMWKRNAAIVAGGLVLASLYVFRSSASLERRFNPGAIPVPSQSWSAHTLEDDPQYYQKLTDWKKNKKSIWQRIFQTKEDFDEE